MINFSELEFLHGAVTNKKAFCCLHFVSAILCPPFCFATNQSIRFLAIYFCLFRVWLIISPWFYISIAFPALLCFLPILYSRSAFPFVFRPAVWSLRIIYNSYFLSDFPSLVHGCQYSAVCLWWEGDFCLLICFQVWIFFTPVPPSDGYYTFFLSDFVCTGRYYQVILKTINLLSSLFMRPSVFASVCRSRLRFVFWPLFVFFFSLFFLFALF